MNIYAGHSGVAVRLATCEARSLESTEPIGATSTARLRCAKRKPLGGSAAPPAARSQPRLDRRAEMQVAIHLTAAPRLRVSRQVFSKPFDKLHMRLVGCRPKNHRVSTRFS